MPYVRVYVSLDELSDDDLIEEMKRRDIEASADDAQNLDHVMQELEQLYEEHTRGDAGAAAERMRALFWTALGRIA